MVACIAVTKYLSYGTTTSVTMVNNGQMTFPAVTVCNNNPVMLSKLMRNSELSAVMGMSNSASSSSGNQSVSGWCRSSHWVLRSTEYRQPCVKLSKCLLHFCTQLIIQSLQNWSKFSGDEMDEWTFISSRIKRTPIYGFEFTQADYCFGYFSSQTGCIFTSNISVYIL